MRASEKVSQMHSDTSEKLKEAQDGYNMVTMRKSEESKATALNL